jgi:hypothetical protein
MFGYGQISAVRIHFRKENDFLRLKAGGAATSELSIFEL